MRFKTSEVFMIGWRVILLLMFVAVAPVVANAQTDFQSDMELLKTNIRGQRIDMVTRSMHFTDAESAAFWPIFKRYETDLDKLTDERIALYKDFSEHFDAITDEKAKDLTQKNIAIEEHRARLKKDYFAQFTKAMSAKTAARFMQVDYHLDLLVNLQLVEQTPLVNSAGYFHSRPSVVVPTEYGSDMSSRHSPNLRPANSAPITRTNADVVHAE